LSSEEKKGKIATAAAVLSATSLAISLGRDAKTKYDERTVYSATLPSDSYIYTDVLEWLNQRVRGKKIRFRSRYSGIKRFYDGAGTANITINGHPFKVSIQRPEIAKDLDSEVIMSHFSEKLLFTTRDPKAFDALEEFFVTITEEAKKEARETLLYTVAGAFSGWNGRPLDERPIESVFLPQGVKEDLMHDLDTFFAHEHQYAKIGIPWHRGYLFYGPPGNGKSSLAAAIASHYKLHLYNLPLSSVKNDRELMEKISSIERNSVLLLEDIDIFSKSMVRKQENGEAPTLAGLLNALDGVATPHGLLTFMTTNNLDTLDDALIRRGRIDKRLELKPPVRYQVEQMFNYVYSEPLGVEPKQFNSMADLSDVFKRFTTDAESARMEIKKA
jgi:hypothetical protein